MNPDRLKNGISLVNKDINGAMPEGKMNPVNRMFMNFYGIFYPDSPMVKNGRMLSVKEIITSSYLNQSRWIAFLLPVFGLSWLIYMLLNAERWNDYTTANAALIFVGLIISIFVFELASSSKPVGNGVLNAILTLYYIVDLLTVMLMNVQRNIDSGLVPSSEIPVGASITSLMMFIPAFFPVPNIYCSISIFISGLCAVFLPMVLPGSDAYNASPYVIMFIGALVGYLVVGNSNRRAAVATQEERKKHHHMSRMSLCDELTGALNGYALSRYRAKYSREKENINSGVIMVDIDSMRSYNASYSRSDGDMVLIKICNIICNALEKDQFLFRYSGERLLVIIPDAYAEMMVQKAKEIVSAVWDANIARNDSYLYDRITVTAGCFLLPSSELLSDSFISQAEDQCSVGKNQNGSCVVMENRVYRGDGYVNDYTDVRDAILIVDDSEFQRELTRDFLEDEYDIIEAANGEEAVQMMEQKLSSIAAVLLDIHMPVMDGFGVLQRMKENGWDNEVPVLIITDESNLEDQEHCLEYRVFDFVSKKLGVSILKLRVRNALERFRSTADIKRAVQDKTIQLAEQNKRLAETNQKITKMLGSVVEARNMESGEHITRVQKFTEILANTLKETREDLDLSDYLVKMIVNASPLHDVGKVMISDNILLKPGRLTPEEYEIMKSHTIKGCEIIEQNMKEWDEEYYRYCYEICRWHHERWDGKGYPDALSGDEIPISAQIVAVADVYDALVTERVYKKAFDTDTAYNMIVNGECGTFSPMMLEALEHSRDKFVDFVRQSREKAANNG